MLAASLTHTNETTSDILNKQTKVFRSFLEHQQSHFQCRNMKLKKFPPPLSPHSLVWTSKDLLPHTDEANSQLPALTATSGMLQHLPTGECLPANIHHTFLEDSEKVYCNNPKCHFSNQCCSAASEGL